ncbi:hypothetical protein BDK51DRAFT_28918, partial [Blyttiomyces helicus]
MSPHKSKNPYAAFPEYTAEDMRKLKVHAVEVPGTRTDLETGIFRNVMSQNALATGFENTSIHSVVDLFNIGSSINPKGNCLGHRPITGYDAVTGAPKWGGFVWQSFERVRERMTHFGDGLMKVYEESGVGDVEKDKWALGIYAINRPEWTIAELGGMLHSNATVALYDTLGPDAAQFILHHSEVPIVVATVDKVPTLLSISGTLEKLKVIVVIPAYGPVDRSSLPPIEVLRKWGAEKGIRILEFSEVELMGLENPRKARLPTEDDIWCICYTS